MARGDLDGPADVEGDGFYKGWFYSPVQSRYSEQWSEGHCRILAEAKIDRKQS